MDISQLLTGGVTGGVIVWVAYQMFSRTIDRLPPPAPDTTGKWLELASRVLDGFKGVATGLEALTESIKQSNSDSAKGRQEAAELFEKVAGALDGVQKALNDFKTDLKGEIKTMKDETQNRITLEELAAKQRHEETGGRLTVIEQEVKGIKDVLTNAPLTKPDALDALKADLTKVMVEALDIRLPNIRADPPAAAIANTPVSNPQTDLSEEDKPDVNPT